ncbi:MAG: hypothetical protein ABIZ57_06040, partial [Candidatus Limnocylindria bacterium]
MVAALLVVTLVGCVPDELDQPTSGDGWRLIGWTRGGEVGPPAVGPDAQQFLAELGLERMAAAVAPTNPETEVEIVVTHAVSCPQVRFDGFSVDEAAGMVEARITDREDLFSLGGSCTSDANPVLYWLAVERALMLAVV